MMVNTTVASQGREKATSDVATTMTTGAELMTMMNSKNNTCNDDVAEGGRGT